ncbi:MAG: DedA family protein [Paludibacteraceae bacterium]|nr:DedA family protein [Paludibacteraceae bacterium]
MGFVDSVISWYSTHMNLASVTALMTIESSFIPFPSEVVIPPAVYMAAAPESPLYVTGVYGVDVALIVLFGTIGAMLGAIINYVLSAWLGRPFIYWFADSKVGHFLLLDGEKVKKAEDYFCAHGKSSTLIGRFIPCIRQLVSIPAGLARMHFGWFCLYTFIGAFAWNCVLALLGYIAHGQMDLIQKYSHEVGLAIIILFVSAFVIAGIKQFIKFRKKN